MRFCSLGSGSAGNALVVEAGSGARPSRVLVDCGFTLREFELRLARAGLAPGDLDAVFVTHEHSDHVGSALALARRHRLPVWASRGTWRAANGKADLAPELLNVARDGEPIAIGELLLQPFAVPHDAQEPLQVTCTDGARRLGVLTDTGTSTAHLLDRLAGCHALVLECNHDRDLLARSRYPASLKTRIAGAYGHLANDSAAQILSGCLHAGLRHVVAAHLSRENNTPALAAAALASACGGSMHEIVVADQFSGVGWLTLA